MDPNFADAQVVPVPCAASPLRAASLRRTTPIARTLRAVDEQMKKGPDVPSGIMARQIDDSHLLYMNVTGDPQEIQMNNPSRSILFDKDYSGNFTIAPYEPEFIEIQ